MPTYTYRCTNPDCLEEVDRFHGMNNAPDCYCEACGYPMKKLMGAPPHKFKNPRGTMGVTTHGRRGITREDISN